MIFESVLGLGSLAVSAYSAVNSFSEAQKQQSLMDQAQKDAQAAMAEAKKKLEINYYKQLAIPKEAYELEREALISSGAQAIQAGVESERGAAATAGRVQMAQTEAQAGQRTAMAKELADLAKLTAAEESRLRDVKVDLDLGEVEGQQKMIADAARAKAQYTQQGFKALTTLAGEAAKLPKLYPTTTTTTPTIATPPTTETNKSPFAAGFPAVYGPQEQAAVTSLKTAATPPGAGSSFLPSDIANMSQDELDSYLATLSPQQQEYYKNYFASQIDPFGYLNK